MNFALTPSAPAKSQGLLSQHSQKPKIHGRPRNAGAALPPPQVASKFIIWRSLRRRSLDFSNSAVRRFRGSLCGAVRVFMCFWTTIALFSLSNAGHLALLRFRCGVVWVRCTVWIKLALFPPRGDLERRKDWHSLCCWKRAKCSSLGSSEFSGGNPALLSEFPLPKIRSPAPISPVCRFRRVFAFKNRAPAAVPLIFWTTTARRGPRAGAAC